MPAPELKQLQAVPDDGRWLLLTSASDRLVPGDHNAATDVFLLDRSNGRLTLVSAALNGRSGNATSLAGDWSADRTRVAFFSRASNLVAGDANQTWDVFIRNLSAGTTTLASPLGDGSNSALPLLKPRILGGGRYLIFPSGDSRLPAGAPPLAFHLDRHDLVENQTLAVTTAWPPDLTGSWRVESFAASPDAQSVAVLVRATGGSSVTFTVRHYDLAGGGVPTVPPTCPRN